MSIMAEYYATEELEPRASEEECSIYERGLQEEREEEEMLTDRFEKAVHLEDWCLCSMCNLSTVQKKEECFCCIEIDRCRDKMNAIDPEPVCITEHPGFKVLCLNKWVLEAASIGLKTKKGRNYTVIRGRSSDSQFYRSVAYRQFFRLVWEYGGNSKRLPLPSCVYHAIRNEFPEKDGIYTGFFEEEEDGNETQYESSGSEP